MNSKQFWARQKLIEFLGALKLKQTEEVWHDAATEWCCPDCDSEYTFIDDCPGHDDDYSHRGWEYNDESSFD